MLLPARNPCAAFNLGDERLPDACGVRQLDLAQAALAPNEFDVEQKTLLAVDGDSWFSRSGWVLTRLQQRHPSLPLPVRTRHRDSASCGAVEITEPASLAGAEGRFKP